MSWYSRFLNWVRKDAEPGPPSAPSAPERRADPDATDEFPKPASIPLVQGLMKLIVGVVSTVGKREHNEDNYYVPGKNPVRPDVFTEGSGEVPASVLGTENVFIVADGMGGQQAGEHASLMAVEIIPKALARRLNSEVTEEKAIQAAVKDAVAEANHEILSCASTSTDMANMGTTVVLALFRRDRVYVAGLGDSPAYRLRQGQFEQLTREHSLAQALYEAGTITLDELSHHKYKNVLYNYLGSKDARSGPEEVRVLDVQPGDRFLLASDGLTGVANLEEMSQVLRSVDDPQRAAQVLKDLALKNESTDNVTALVIHIVSEAGAVGPKIGGVA